MGATATLLAGPASIGGLGHKAIFSVLLDNSFAAGGEPIDLTDYFTEIYSAVPAGVDAAADATWTYFVVLPSNGTAIEAATVLITAHHGSGADAVNNAADAEDLSTVGELRIEVTGTLVKPS